MAINISDITNNVSTNENTNGDIDVIGDGYFDDLMETVNTQLKAQYDNGRITGPVYANVYAAMMQTVLGQSMQFALQKGIQEAQGEKISKEVEIAEIAREVAESTKQHKIDKSLCEQQKVCAESQVAVDTVDTKIELAENQTLKVANEASYVEQQETQLIASVGYNNLIKSIDALGDTYGTFGAGGLTVDDAMWETYYNLIAEVISPLVTYKGEWDATTAFPNPTDPAVGDYYVISNADEDEIDPNNNVNVDGTSDWSIGDTIVYSGTRWKKSPTNLPTTYAVSDA